MRTFLIKSGALDKEKLKNIMKKVQENNFTKNRPVKDIVG
jgi:hypothetical protein